MATTRRDLAPRKGKTGGQSPSHKTNKAASNSPKKRSTSSLRMAAVRSSANDVHKQLVKTPTSSDSAHKPALTARRKADKTSLPAAQKTRGLSKPPLPSRDQTTQLTTQKRQVSTTPSLRSRDSTPLPAQRKRGSTNPSIRPRDKTPLPAQKTSVLTSSSLRPRDQTPLRARKKQVSPSPFPEKTIASEKTVPGVCSEQETIYSITSTTKEQISYTFHENIENMNVYQSIPEVEILLEDREPFAFSIQQEVQTVVKFASGDERGIICSEPEEDGDHDKGTTEVVTLESSPVFGQGVFVDVKTHDSEETSFIEEKLDEPEETNDYHKEETVEVVEKQKQKPENKAQTQGGSRWKNGHVVSNNAIEETASKLRDQRTSRVRALAGAFESVMQ